MPANANSLNSPNSPNNIGNVLYFIVLTIVIFTALYYGSDLIRKTTTNHIPYIIYISFLTIVYVISLGMYYLKWDLTNIFIMIILLSVVLSFVSFILLYTANSACQGGGTPISTAGWVKYVLMILGTIVITLGFYHFNNADWDTSDAIRFVIMLVIIRLMYYLVNTYNYDKARVMLNIITLVVIILQGKRLFFSFKSIA